MNRLIELKIKRMTLAAEARLIRREERWHLGKGRTANAVSQILETPDSGPGRIELALSLLGYSEARIARIQARLKSNDKPIPPDSRRHYATYHSLHAHRTGIVREQARVMQLAHHYLKGHPFQKAEQGKTELPTWLVDRVAREVTKFAVGADSGCRPKDILWWVEGNPTLAQEAAVKAEQVEAERRLVAG